MNFEQKIQQRNQREIEKMILGSVLNKQRFSLIQSMASIRFCCPQNQFIFQIMHELFLDQQIVDAQNVINQLKYRNIFEGISYVEQLLEYDIREPNLIWLIRYFTEQKL